MTALPNAMTTRNGVLTTVKALERALRQAEFDRPASDSAPLSFRAQGYMPAHARVTACGEGGSHRRNVPECPG
jgi:hypothetical protein